MEGRKTKGERAVLGLAFFRSHAYRAADIEYHSDFSDDL